MPSHLRSSSSSFSSFDFVCARRRFPGCSFSARRQIPAVLADSPHLITVNEAAKTFRSKRRVPPLKEPLSFLGGGGISATARQREREDVQEETHNSGNCSKYTAPDLQHWNYPVPYLKLYGTVPPCSSLMLCAPPYSSLLLLSPFCTSLLLFAPLCSSVLLPAPPRSSRPLCSSHYFLQLQEVERWRPSLFWALVLAAAQSASSSLVV